MTQNKDKTIKMQPSVVALYKVWCQTWK